MINKIISLEKDSFWIDVINWKNKHFNFFPAITGKRSTDKKFTNGKDGMLEIVGNQGDLNFL